MRRPEVVSRFYEELLVQRCALIQASPNRGKTAFLTLLEAHLQNLAVPQRIVRINFLDRNTNQSIEDFWAKSCNGETFEQTLSTTTPTFILCDEVQLLNGQVQVNKDEIFWRALRKYGGIPNVNSHVVLATTYILNININYQTPFQFNLVCGNDLHRFTRAETGEYIAAWVGGPRNNKLKSLENALTPAVVSALHAMTDGSAGLLRDSMEAINRKFFPISNLNQPPTENDILLFLSSFTFYNAITTPR
ncbi:hypothetical protein HDV00_012827, partial [Rhizophlyctis rosea]